MTKNIDLLTRWVEALRSGNFKQCRGSLYTTSIDKNGNETRTGYCCLGVLHTLEPNILTSCNANVTLDEESLRAHLGISIQQDILVDKNDLHDKDFQQIADYIEQRYLNNKGNPP
jgi:hypothetical protein